MYIDVPVLNNNAVLPQNLDREVQPTPNGDFLCTCHGLSSVSTWNPGQYYTLQKSSF